MVPATQNDCQHLAAEYRIIPVPLLPGPPNHVMMYSFCPCGTRRTHFTVHQNILHQLMGRHELITPPLSLIQRVAEMQLHGRYSHRRYPYYRANHAGTKMHSDEEDIER